MAKNKRALGGEYEKKAALFLEAKGYRIVTCNYRCRSGEIDVIAMDGRYLVFVEVKFRSSDSLGFSLEAIDKRKAERIRRAAAFYLYENHYPEETPCRFDAVGVDYDRMIHIKDAF